MKEKVKIGVISILILFVILLVTLFPKEAVLILPIMVSITAVIFLIAGIKYLSKKEEKK